MNTIHNHNREIIGYYSAWLLDYISLSFTRSSGLVGCSDSDWPSGFCLLQSAMSSISVNSAWSDSARPNILHLLMKRMPPRPIRMTATTTETTTASIILAELVQLTNLKLLTNRKNSLSPSWRLCGGLREADLPLAPLRLNIRTQPQPCTSTFFILLVEIFLTVFSSPLRT